jgi:hypothetical protein
LHPQRASRAGGPSRGAAVVAFLLLCLGGFAQEVTPERVRTLEEALTAERARNDAQAQRIEELELTLASVVTAQADESRQAALVQQIEKLGSTFDEKLAQIRTRRDESDGVSVSGQMRFVLRFFDGADISTDRSFEIEHLIIQINLQLEEKVRVKLSPGISHQGAVYMLEAYGAYAAAPGLEVWGGRFLVPFNGIHAWAFPSDSFIEPYLPENAPKPFFYSPYWDEGLLGTGRFSFGCRDEHEFWYAAYVINGLDPLGMIGIHKTNIGDNNDNKTIGGRASATFRLGEQTTLAIGVAGMSGKYDNDDRDAFYAVEADAELVSGPFSVYLEAFARPAEITGTVVENPMAVITEVSHLFGFKLRPQLRIRPDLAIFAQLDHLEVRQPPRMGGQFSVLSLNDESFAISTAVLGIKYDVTPHLRLQVEAGIFDRDSDIGPDIRYFAVSMLTYF